MRLVDAQLHVCLPDGPDTPWPTWARPYAQGSAYPITPDQVLAGMDAAGVERAAIQVPTWFCGRDEYAVQCAEQYPDRFAVMARPVLNDPREESRLRALFEHDAVRGVRAVYIDDAFGDLSAESWLTDGTSDWLFELAVELDFPVMLWAPRSTSGVGEVADRYPGLQIMLDQMNGFNAPENPDGFRGALAPVLRLAERPNVGVKLRLWDWQFAEPMRSASFVPLMQEFVEAFAPERCFWSSDFLNHQAFSTSELRDAFADLPFLDDRARRLLMGDALSIWLRWP